MKIAKNIMTLAAAALFAACQTDIDTPQIGNPETFVAPVISACSDVVVNADNAESENVVFSWTAADFGLPIQIQYQVYLVRGGVESMVGATNSTSLAVSKGDLNGVVINGLGASANETVEVTAYVAATVANSTVYEAVKSEQTSAFTVTTYQAALKWLFLCGEFNNWTETTAPIFWETGGGTNTYTCMVDFTPINATPTDPGKNSFFKVLPDQSWATSYGQNELSASWAIAENKDGNLSMPISDAVIHEISVNTSSMSISQTAIGNTLGLVGTFSNWADGADAIFTYDPLTSTWKTEPVSLEANAEIKIRVDGKWDTSWGSTGKSSTAVAGGVELDSSDNYKVAEAGTYIAVLHANRTPMVLELQKQ